VGRAAIAGGENPAGFTIAVMPRLLAYLLLGALIVSQAGCLRFLTALADVTPGEGGTDKRAVSYNAKASLAEGDAHPGVHDETLANLDRVLEEHPEAVNRSELQDLRRQLGGRGEADAAPPTSDASLEDLGAVAQGEAVFGPAEPPPDPHDRRIMDWTDDRVGPQSLTNDLGLVHHRTGIDNDLAVMRAAPRRSVVGKRSHDDFTSVPRQSSMGTHEPPLPIERLTGVGEAMTSTDRDALPLEP